MNKNAVRRRLLAFLPALAVVLVVVGAKFALIVETAVDTPFWDQWDGEADRLYAPFLEGTLPFARLFEAHNEHRLFLQRAMALALLQINRLWDPLAQMALNAILHAACAFVLILGATKRLGARQRLLVAVLFAVLFAGAAGWENTLAGFGTQFYLLLLFSLLFFFVLAGDGGLRLRAWPGLLLLGLACGLSLASGFLTALAGACLVVYLMLLRRSVGRAAVATLGLLVGGTAVGWATLTTVPGTAQFRAAGPGDFALAFLHNVAWPFVLAWPFVFEPWLAALVQLPWLVLVLGRLRRGGPDNALFRFTVVLGVWGLLQAAALAWGRGHGGGAPTSRYHDLLVIGAAASALAFVQLRPRISSGLHARRLYWIALLPWFALVAYGAVRLDAYMRHAENQVTTKRIVNAIEERYVSLYTATGDVAYLANKPFLYIPYPDSGRLRSFLDRPSLRSILPSAIRPPVACKVVQVDGFVPLAPLFEAPSLFGGPAFRPGFRSSDSAAARLRLDCVPPRRSAWLLVQLGFARRGRQAVEVVLHAPGDPARSLFAPSRTSRVKALYFRAPEAPFTLEVTAREATGPMAMALPTEIGPIGIILRQLLPHGLSLQWAGVLLLVVAPVLVLRRYVRLCRGRARGKGGGSGTRVAREFHATRSSSGSGLSSIAVRLRELGARGGVVAGIKETRSPA